MLKKLGGKFKKVFSRKKQSLAQKPNEEDVQNVQPETTALPTSVLRDIEQPCKAKRSDITPTHVGVDEEIQPLDNTWQELAASASCDPAAPCLGLVSQDAPPEVLSQDPVRLAPSSPQQSAESSGSSGFSVSSSEYRFNTDRKRLLRSNSSPPSPSLPSTGASSETLYHSLCISDASSPSSFLKFRQVLDERRRSNSLCHKVLAEYLKGEEEENANIEWAALVEWMKISHQAEMIVREKDHAVIVERLRQERSEERRRLELRNRELRAIKREMKDLKKAFEENNKDQEEIYPSPNSQSADESDAVSVDQDEGGVTLATNGPVRTENVESVREQNCESVQEVGAADYGKRIDDEGTNQAKTSRKKTKKEEKKLQQALKLRLMENSAPEAPLEAETDYPAAIGEPKEGDPSQKAIAIKDYNKSPFTEVKDLQDHNKALQNSLAFTHEVIHNMQMEAELKEEELNKLKAENHFAQLEVGHVNAANACYREVLEDENPARTAHLDGLLKRKDEAYAELEKRAAECAEQLAEEKKRRGVENVYSEAQIQGLKKELAHRFNTIQALTEGKGILKQQNDSIFQLFQGKIVQNDAFNAFLRDYDILHKDNALLIKLINERKCYIQDAEKQIAHLKAGKLVTDHAAQTETLKHRQTQQGLNGLTCINNQLTAKLEIQTDMRDERRAGLEAELKQRSDELDLCLRSGADEVLVGRNRALEIQIADLKEDVRAANGVANHWRIRALEQQDEWCPMLKFADVADFGAEDARWRLREAERRVGVLERAVREGRGREVLEVRGDGGKWLRDRMEAGEVREEVAGWRGGEGEGEDDGEIEFEESSL